jgi:hypothetical protein
MKPESLPSLVSSAAAISPVDVASANRYGTAIDVAPASRVELRRDAGALDAIASANAWACVSTSI